MNEWNEINWNDMKWIEVKWNEWMNEGMEWNGTEWNEMKWTNEWTNECIYVWMHECMNAWRKERTNEWVVVDAWMTLFLRWVTHSLNQVFCERRFHWTTSSPNRSFADRTLRWSASSLSYFFPELPYLGCFFSDLNCAHLFSAHISFQLFSARFISSRRISALLM